MGCVLFHLCSKSPPFYGENLISLGYNIVNKVPKKIPSSYSKELKKFITSLLEKKPSIRPTARQALQTLDKLGKGLDMRKPQSGKRREIRYIDDSAATQLKQTDKRRRGGSQKRGLLVSNDQRLKRVKTHNNFNMFKRERRKMMLIKELEKKQLKKVERDGNGLAGDRSSQDEDRIIINSIDPSEHHLELKRYQSAAAAVKKPPGGSVEASAGPEYQILANQQEYQLLNQKKEFIGKPAKPKSRPQSHRKLYGRRGQKRDLKPRNLFGSMDTPESSQPVSPAIKPFFKAPAPPEASTPLQKSSLEASRAHQASSSRNSVAGRSTGSPEKQLPENIRNELNQIEEGLDQIEDNLLTHQERKRDALLRKKSKSPETPLHQKQPFLKDGGPQTLIKDKSPRGRAMPRTGLLRPKLKRDYSQGGGLDRRPRLEVQQSSRVVALKKKKRPIDLRMMPSQANLRNKMSKMKNNLKKNRAFLKNKLVRPKTAIAAVSREKVRRPVVTQSVIVGPEKSAQSLERNLGARLGEVSLRLHGDGSKEHEIDRRPLSSLENPKIGQNSKNYKINTKGQNEAQSVQNDTILARNVKSRPDGAIIAASQPLPATLIESDKEPRRTQNSTFIATKTRGIGENDLGNLTHKKPRPYTANPSSFKSRAKHQISHPFINPFQSAFTLADPNKAPKSFMNVWSTDSQKSISRANLESKRRSKGSRQLNSEINRPVGARTRPQTALTKKHKNSDFEKEGSATLYGSYKSRYRIKTAHISSKNHPENRLGSRSSGGAKKRKMPLFDKKSVYKKLTIHDLL